jgi:hypothetical protein
MPEHTPGPIHTHLPADAPIRTCPRCRLDMAAPEMLLELRRCAMKLGGWMERREIPTDVAHEMALRFQAVNITIAKAED